MSVHQVHPRSTFQKQFRTRPLRQQKATFLSARAAVLSRGSVQRVRAEGLCRGSVQRHTIFRKIPCVAKGKLPFCHDSAQRHTISRGKTCIATAEYRKSRSTMQRHTIFRKILCVAKGKPLRTQKNNRRPTKKSLQESGTIDADTFISGT